MVLRTRELYKLSRMEGRRTERATGNPIDHELDEHVMVGKVHQILRRELGSELACEERRILRAEAERDERPDVGQDRVSYVGFELVQMLMRQYQAHLKLP